MSGSELSVDARWDRTLQFYRIDSAGQEVLRAFRPVVADRFSIIIDGFYRHIAAFDMTKTGHRRAAGIEKLKILQQEHWLKIFSAEFDEAYRKELKRIGRLHYQAGIDTSWLLGGYAYIGGELLALAHREYSRFFKIGSGVSVEQLEQVLMQVILLNSQFALSVYFKRKTSERVALVRRVAENMEHEAQSLVADIGHLTRDMSDAAETLRQAAETSREMTECASSATEEVLASAQTVASATEELSNSIAEIASQVARTRDISGRAVGISAEGAACIRSLTDAVGQIGTFVDVISSIARQTNMLALNASIEAARSGEAGRGFAIVANEVRDLAAHTAEATGNIARQIDEVNRQTQAVSAAMQQSATVLGTLDESAASIAASIEEQSAATREIARSVEDNARSAREVSKMMEDVRGQAAQTSELTGDLLQDGLRINATVGGLKTSLTRVARTSSDDANRRSAVRHGVLFEATAMVEKQSFSGSMTNLSERGCLLILAEGSVPPDTRVILDCPSIGSRLDGHVVAVSGVNLHICFNVPLAAERIEGLSLDGARRIVERAKSDHVAFMNTIYATVDGTGRAKASDLANHHTCRLGKWYDAVSDKRMRSSPSYAALAEPHRKVHHFGKLALAAVAAGNGEQAGSLSQEARKASEEVLRLLDKLGQEILSCADSAVETAGNVVPLRRATI